MDGALRAFAEGLGPRERAILDERLLADEPLTLDAIGRRFGISRERTRQIEKRLLRRLRERFERVRAAAEETRRCTACDSSRTKHLCTCGRAWPRREAA
jgi:DNA-directed RNA polymerase sigma subunit (sigma70/sigma32)